jgi:hypothetical protein
MSFAQKVMRTIDETKLKIQELYLDLEQLKNPFKKKRNIGYKRKTGTKLKSMKSSLFMTPEGKGGNP